MRIILFLFCCAFTSMASAQQIPVLKPTSVTDLDFPAEVIKNFNSETSLANCEKVYKKLENKNYQLTAADEKVLSRCDEMKESPFEVIGGGCSWYCLGGGDSVTASSQLNHANKDRYSPSNAHDLDYETAWVEGVEGNGIGEYLRYHFRPYKVTVHTIIVANGYVKTQEAWTNNARVKKLKVSVNGKPFAIFELEDRRADQAFSIPPISYSEKAGGTIQFEILEVYPGAKYQDAVISEIYFDGPSH